MNRSQLLALLARLPARFWLQAAFGLVGFFVLAVLGFALLAGVAATILIAILGFKARDWLAGMLGGRSKPPATTRNASKVIDVQYEIVDRGDRR